MDFKGAPPKVSYLAEIFPLFRALGANGLLIEYEDMFPYEGHLSQLRAVHAYSPAEVTEILRLARLSKLEVVPLVQTFGHMEVRGMDVGPDAQFIPEQRAGTALRGYTLGSPLPTSSQRALRAGPAACVEGKEGFRFLFEKSPRIFFMTR